MIEITPIIQAGIIMICTVITGVLIPLIKSKTTLSQRQELMEWVQIAVSAAEQLYKGTGRGQEKKAYVVKWLLDRGIQVKDKEIDAMIESAVHDLNAGALLLGEAVEVKATEKG